MTLWWGGGIPSVSDQFVCLRLHYILLTESDQKGGEGDYLLSLTGLSVCVLHYILLTESDQKGGEGDYLPSLTGLSVCVLHYILLPEGDL